MPFALVTRAVALTALLPVLASCSAISAVNSATAVLEVLELQPPTEIAAVQRRALALDIIIEEPTTSGALATDRIMIRPGPLQAQYLPGVRWSDDAPVMLQTLLLRALDATRAFEYVGRSPLGASGDFAIVTELTDFQAERMPDGTTALVNVGMISRIVRESDLEVIATRRFAASETSASLEDRDIAEAFDAAAGRVVSAFAGWALSSLGSVSG